MFDGEPVASIPGGRMGAARVWDVRGSFEPAEALAALPGAVSVEDAARSLLSGMLLVRRFEETAVELMRQGRIVGAVHTSIGQEATAVGICSALAPQDLITGTHRSHGHLLAKGSSPKALMAELFGKTTGVSRGRGGSMHVADIEKGSLGASGIVGGGLPIAVGAAWARRLRGEDLVSLAFFGDGAANQGMVHEAMNLAAVWRTPTIFVCENNGYAISTPTEDAVAGEHIAYRALAYGFDGCIADGQNVFEMLAVATSVTSLVRSRQAPFLIEAKTYRYREHAEGISLAYRDNSEIEDWKSRRDPIATFVATTDELGILSPSDVVEIEDRINEVMSEAVAFAQDSPAPDPSELYRYLYA